ncbi:hypothetical protein CY35_13G015600 [Sphagnum magellanicum]|nr:hypothetical protein CY35_13G015600 [Sphagnum magellanicum]
MQLLLPMLVNCWAMGASYAVRSIQNSFQILTSEHIQLISNMMEQQKQFAFNANIPLDKDVRVTAMAYSLLSQCDFGWGTPCCKQNILPSFLYNNLIIWNHKIKPLDPWVFAYKTTPEVANRMSKDQEFLELSILGLCYKTLRHQNLPFTQQEDLSMSSYISISQKVCSIRFDVHH